MATTISTEARNASCNATVDLLDGGSPGKIRLKSAGGTVIAEATLSNPAFGNAANGVAALAGTPLAGAGIAAAGAGTAAATFEFTKSDNTVVISGAVGTGSGELDLDNVNIADGQAISVASFSHTQPGS